MNNDLRELCVGTPFDSNQFQDWKDVWNDNKCLDLYNNILYTLPGGQIGYNSTEIPGVQSDFNNIFKKYEGYGFDLTDQILGPNFNDFQNTLYFTCSSIPGACDTFLENYCSKFSRLNIASNPVNLEFCGCFASQQPNSPLTRVCQTLCTRQRVIKLPDGIGGFDECNQAVCVIDNISIESTKASTGQTNIVQICTNCPTQGCQCFINLDDLEEIKQEVGQTNVIQFCGSNATCFNTAPNDQVVQAGQCNIPNDPIISNNIPVYVWIIAGVIIVITVLVLLVVILSR